MADVVTEIIAVSWSSFQESGCVACGCDYCHTKGIQGGGTVPVQCGECRTDFVILDDGLNVSSFGWGSGDGLPIYPTLQDHPRKGIPKHPYVRPDIRPETGGEYWSPRGVGYGRFGPDLSGFVKSKPAGQRIMEMVQCVIGKPPQSFLDYRDYEPTHIQVKIEAVDGVDLDRLCALCSGDGIITEERLRQSLVSAPV